MSQGLLLSGGIDSACIARWKKPKWACTIDYGQITAAAEIRSAVFIAKALKIQHVIIKVDCRSLGTGSMAGAPPAPKAKRVEWWPFRNQLLATLTGMAALKAGVHTLLIGTVKSDRIHRDGSPAFLQRLDALFRCQEGSMHIVAPAINLTTRELIHRSRIPRSILYATHSCHRSDRPCGQCNGCHKHLSNLDWFENQDS